MSSNQKTYEIAFRLSAFVNSSVRAAFAKANQEIEKFKRTAEQAGKASVKMSLVANGFAAITAAAAPATAAVMGLGASFAAAGAGATAYGIVASSAISKVVEASDQVSKIQEKIDQADTAKERIAAQKELAAVYADMSAEQRKALQNLQSFKTFWDNYTQSFEKPIFQAFGNSLQIAQNGLNLLKPTITNVADVVVELTEKFNEALQGPAVKGFFDWLSTNASEAIYNFAVISGNSFMGVMNLLQAFAPMGASVEEVLVRLSRRFAEWSAGLSKSKAFQSFIEYAKQNGPVLMGIIGNIFSILKNLFSQLAPVLAPMGSTILKAIEGVTGFVANLLSAEHPISGFGNTVKSVFENIAPTISSLVAKAGPLLKNIGSTARQAFTQIFAFWQQNGPAIVSAVSNVFKVAGSIAGGLIRVFLTIFTIIRPVLSQIVAFMRNIAAQLIQFWSTDGAQIAQAVRNVFSVIVSILRVIGPVILLIVNTIWTNVRGIIQGGLNIILGIIRIFTGLFTGDFHKMWQGVKQLFIGAIQFIWNFVNLLFVGRIIGGIKALATGAITRFSSMWTTIKSFFSGGVGNVWTLVLDLGSKIRQGFTIAKNAAVSLAKEMWTGVKRHFGDIVSGARSLPEKIGSGIASMAGKALSGLTTMTNKMLRGIGKMVNGVIKGLNWILRNIGVGAVINEWKVPQYAYGTSGHPGGLALVGDGTGSNAGPELYRLPNGQIGLTPATPTLMNFPKGTQVIAAKTTSKILSDYNIPAYAEGNIITNAYNAGKEWIADKVSDAKDMAIDVFSYVTKPAELLKKVLDKAGVTVPNLPAVLGEIASGSYKLIKSKALDFVKKKLADFGDFSNFKGSGAELARKAITMALRMLGKPMSLLGPLMSIAQHESGFNPNAVNNWDINAKRGDPSVGLFQIIGSTFRRYMYPGHGNRRNPLDSSLAAIRYMDARYGGVMNHPGIRSMMRGGGYKPYKNGGRVGYEQWALVGEEGPELLRLSGGTQVINNGKTTSLLSGLLSFISEMINGSAPTVSKNSNTPDQPPIQIIYSPNNYFQGEVDETAVEKVNKLSFDQFEQFMDEYFNRKKRLAYD